MKVYRNLVVSVIKTVDGVAMVHDGSGNVFEVNEKEIIAYPEAELASCVERDMACTYCPHNKDGCTRVKEKSFA